MIFANKNQPAAKPAQTPNTDIIFDVGTEQFEEKVMRASMETPVLADFWAPWCGPCKQLAPVLEAAVLAASGKIKLAKINIDDNPELAQALRVQSVPTVYAFFNGQPVTAFNGVRSQTEIKNLIDQLVKIAQQAQPDSLDIPVALAQAAQALSQNDFMTAQDMYAAILAQDEKNVQAYTGLVRTFIAAGQTEDARAMIDNAPDAIAASPQFAAARTALELAETLPDNGDSAALQAKIEMNPDDHQSRFDLALALFARGQKETAMDELIEIIRRNRTWEEDKARLQLLKFFEAAGPADPVTVSGRRKLSTVLFS